LWYHRSFHKFTYYESISINLGKSMAIHLKQL
jgi:hypothetical protein